jgi:hypothetical protein
MDWKQFIASIVSSLTSMAWPIVIGILLYRSRETIGPLVGRLIELTLPGGVKATFERQLEKAREQAEELPRSKAEIQHGPTPPPPDKDPSTPYKPTKPPFAVIIDAYKDVEALLLVIGDELAKREPTLKLGRGTRIMEELYRRRLVDENAFELFQTLRKARNTAAHTGSGSQLTDGEAFDYALLANRVTEVLAGVLLRLGDKDGLERVGA